MVNLSLEHGNTDASCFRLRPRSALIAGPRFGDYEAGFRFGRLGYELIERRGLQRFKARTYHVFGNFIVPWTNMCGPAASLILRAFEVANTMGDLTFAAYAAAT